MYGPDNDSLQIFINNRRTIRIHNWFYLHNQLRFYRLKSTFSEEEERVIFTITQAILEIKGHATRRQ